MAVDALRPERLEDFTGQADVVRHLRITLDAAQQRGELCDHILLSGPPGLGKTTLAAIIANELGVSFEATSGPVLAQPKDVVSVLAGLDGPSVVFIDETHRMPRIVEEVLYSAMEDGELDIKVGEGDGARIYRVKVKPFVLIGATTQLGLLSAPLRARFGFVATMRRYDTATLTVIVKRSARLLGMSIDDDGAATIAGRSRGTPRVANTNLRRVRDWAQVHGIDAVDATTAAAALDDFQIDKLGLDAMGVDILDALCTRFNGGPVGAATLAAAINEAVSTVEAYEPFLMSEGLLTRTPRGRMATPATYEHLGLDVPASIAQSAAGTGGGTLFDQAD